MTLKDGLLAEFDHEMGTTRKLLERAPDDRLGWQPHPKSMTLGGVCTHLANLPNWGTMILADPSYDLDAAPPNIDARTSRAEILSFFDESSGRTRAALDKTDAELVAPWTLVRGGHQMFTMPKVTAFRTFVLYHSVHHRGQLSVYLRLNDIPVPSIYGPRGDELWGGVGRGGGVGQVGRVGRVGWAGGTGSGVYPPYLPCLPACLLLSRRRRRRRGIDDRAEEADHHFLEGLIAPLHGLRRIGVELVVRRVVVVRDDFDLGPLRQQLRLLEHVADLPVEVVLRHREQRLRRAVGIVRDIDHVLAAHVHVRRHRRQERVLLDFRRRLHFVVVRVRRNREAEVDDIAARDHPLRRLLREDDPDLGLVVRRRAV